MADQIILNHVTKRFTTKTLGDIVAVDDFNLSVHEGECFSFLGPSGCGKSTTLRMARSSSAADWCPAARKTCTSRRKSAGWAWCSRPSRSGRT